MPASTPRPTPTPTPDPALVAAHPPFGLVIRSGPLTLRPLADADLPEYLDLLRRPVFADPEADHVFPWYRADPEERAREAVRFQWRTRAALRAEDWSLPLGVWTEGRLVGCQDVGATSFAVRRTVSSGSWLTLDQHGRGLGALMRRAMLVVAFDHLGAVRAESEAVLGNAPSMAVSRSCGYRENGTTVQEESGRAITHRRFVVTPETFERRDVTVEVEGLTAELRAVLGA